MILVVVLALRFTIVAVAWSEPFGSFTMAVAVLAVDHRHLLPADLAADSPPDVVRHNDLSSVLFLDIEGYFLSFLNSALIGISHLIHKRNVHRL